MKFLERKRHKPPTIIIISLIDILIVLLIFMMVTTTFKHKPALNVSLPQSRSKMSTQAEPSSVTISILKDDPDRFYWGEEALSKAELEEKLKSVAAKDPNTALIIRSDVESYFGKTFFVMDAARMANLKKVKVETEAVASEQ